MLGRGNEQQASLGAERVETAFRGEAWPESVFLEVYESAAIVGCPVAHTLFGRRDKWRREHTPVPDCVQPAYLSPAQLVGSVFAAYFHRLDVRVGEQGRVAIGLVAVSFGVREHESAEEAGIGHAEHAPRRVIAHIVEHSLELPVFH